jgi:hypothetical protein
MARGPSTFRQADIVRAIRAAKQAGAAEVEVWTSKDVKIVIRLTPSTGKDEGLERRGEIVL